MAGHDLFQWQLTQEPIITTPSLHLPTPGVIMVANLLETFFFDFFSSMKNNKPYNDIIFFLKWLELDSVDLN